MIHKIHNFYVELSIIHFLKYILERFNQAIVKNMK